MLRRVIDPPGGADDAPMSLDVAIVFGVNPPSSLGMVSSPAVVSLPVIDTIAQAQAVWNNPEESSEEMRLQERFEQSRRRPNAVPPPEGDEAKTNVTDDR
jgi:hypothetical protein